MTCTQDTSLNSLTIRTQAVYIACGTLTAAGFAGVGATTPAQLQAQLIAAYGAIAGDFETIAGALYLRLPVRDTDYKPEYVYLDDSPQFNRSLAVQTYQVRAYSYRFMAKVGSDLAYLFYLTDAIRRSTLDAQKRFQTGLTVIDAVLPDEPDYLAARVAGTNPYTVRFGVLKPVKPTAGTVGQGVKRAMVGGFEFEFEQYKLRI
jgi:hypothetical protein